MTKQEILAMQAGRELNIRVTEDVMGCKFVEDKIFGDMEICNGVYGPLRPYSEDGSHAWQVVDKMKFNDDFVSALCEIADVVPNGSARTEIGFLLPKLSPEMICKAALLAKLGVA